MVALMVYGSENVAALSIAKSKQIGLVEGIDSISCGCLGMLALRKNAIDSCLQCNL